ncbi:MAG: hypothetical protein JWM25_720 [Thermoleophilia bacterium]|jgi:hypothetical protein|nr:hypothetical protein [Thermoleophilia bacterium]
MSTFRGMVGAAFGAAAAAVALRVRAVSKERNEPIGSTLADLPNILSEDASRVKDAARYAFDDGREAADRARNEFDEQVAARTRRK